MPGTEPFEKRCKKHAEGKQKSPEHRNKLSKAIKELQTEEVRNRKSEFMLDHPELWVEPRPDLGQEAWRGRHHTDESKKAISDGIKKAYRDKNVTPTTEQQ